MDEKALKYAQEQLQKLRNPALEGRVHKDFDMDKNMDWIYNPVNEPDLDNTLAAVEKALGFKLFIWQKTFIATGKFRRYGATTAEILRELLAVDERPLDYTAPPGSCMAALYRAELLKIKEKLDVAGVPTRKVATSRKQLREYTEQFVEGLRKDNTYPKFEEVK